jgi:hypothetical protein
LGAIHSFVAVYTTAMFVTDAITAILLFAQFSILRSRAILVIASGCLLTALLSVPYLLAFPSVLAPDGVVGGLQTTGHLCLLWHCGFPLLVIGYTFSKDEEQRKRFAPAEVRSAICHAIMEAHEGRLWVSPNVPQGSVFQFTVRGIDSAVAGT